MSMGQIFFSSLSEMFLGLSILYSSVDGEIYQAQHLRFKQTLCFVRYVQSWFATTVEPY